MCLYVWVDAEKETEAYFKKLAYNIMATWQVKTAG